MNSTEAKQRYLTWEGVVALPLFLQPRWLDQFGIPWNVSLYEEAGTIQAVWVYFLEKKWGMKLVRNPLSSPYTGLYFITDCDEAVAIQQLNASLPRSAVFQSCTYPQNMKDPELISGPFIQITPKPTYRLSLDASEEALWMGLSPKRRNLIRQMQKSLIVTEAGASDLAEFYSYIQTTFSAKDIRIGLKKEELETLYKTAEQEQLGKLLVCKSESAHEAYVFLVYDRYCTYYLYAATRPGSSYSGANSLLLWDAIIRSKRLGKRIFDFEGSSIEGIARFFKSFGGTPDMYYHMFQSNSWIYDLKQKL